MAETPLQIEAIRGRCGELRHFHRKLIVLLNSDSGFEHIQNDPVETSTLEVFNRVPGRTDTWKVGKSKGCKTEITIRLRITPRSEKYQSSLAEGREVWQGGFMNVFKNLVKKRQETRTRGIREGDCRQCAATYPEVAQANSADVY